MPSSVAFMRFPLVFNEKWASLAKAFYVAHAMGNAAQLEPKIFKAIHKDNIDLSNEQLLRSFMVDNGIDEKNFLDQYHSFTVSKEVKKASDIGNAYQITVSPVIIINGPSGSFYLTAALAGNEKALLTVMDHVIADETQKLPKASIDQKSQGSSPIEKSK
jgi:thiol:disulfide interchange protein DsbA